MGANWPGEEQRINDRLAVRGQGLIARADDKHSERTPRTSETPGQDATRGPRRFVSVEQLDLREPDNGLYPRFRLVCGGQ